MTTHDTTTGIRLEGTPQSPERAAFMAALSEHEDIASALAIVTTTPNASRAELLEKFRMSRRAVVAAYDRATLGAGRTG